MFKSSRRRVQALSFTPWRNRSRGGRGWSYQICCWRIGTLLEDGLGDTVRVVDRRARVWLPVAYKLVNRYKDRVVHAEIEEIEENSNTSIRIPQKRTFEVGNIGQTNVPRVIADLSQIESLEIKDLKSVGHFYLPESDKWAMNDQGTDYVYLGSKGIAYVAKWVGTIDRLPSLEWVIDRKNTYPVFTLEELSTADSCDDHLNLIKLQASELSEEIMSILEADNLVVLLETDNAHAMPALRRFFFELERRKLKVPVIITRNYLVFDEEQFLIDASTDVGGLLVDGFGDGVMLTAATTMREDLLKDIKLKNETAFGILQAGRTRMTKTEYISCPSCGRTLFDLQETTAMIRKRTDHLKGVKIGIMGCIVNGPGEMADADYGYVGSGKGKITLYKGQKVVKRGVPSEYAVDELIEIIREDGNWLEPQAVIT